MKRRVSKARWWTCRLQVQQHLFAKTGSVGYSRAILGKGVIMVGPAERACFRVRQILIRLERGTLFS